MKNFGLKHGHKEKQEQEELKKVYGIKKDVLVVERKSRIVLLSKTIFDFFLSLLRIGGMVALCILATIGLMALVYPSIRAAFSIELEMIFKTIQEFIGL